MTVRLNCSVVESRKEKQVRHQSKLKVTVDENHQNLKKESRDYRTTQVRSGKTSVGNTKNQTVVSVVNVDTQKKTSNYQGCIKSHLGFYNSVQLPEPDVFTVRPLVTAANTFKET
jgi:hypothetical protein